MHKWDKWDSCVLDVVACADKCLHIVTIFVEVKKANKQSTHRKDDVDADVGRCGKLKSVTSRPASGGWVTPEVDHR